MKVEIIRPEIPDDSWDTLSKYLLDHFDRAQMARKEQVDDKQLKYIKND